MNRRVVRLSVVVLLTAAACSSGDDDAGGSVEAWCAVAERIETAEDTFGDEMFDEDGARGAFDELSAILAEGRNVAPAAISGDVDEMADAVDRFSAIFDGVDFDLARADDDQLAELEALSFELDDASAGIRAFNDAECEPSEAGIADAVSGTDAAAPGAEGETASPASTAPPAFSGDADSPWCVAARDVDITATTFAAAMTSPPDQLESFVTDALGLLEAAQPDAPAELAGPVDTTVSGLRDLDAALRDAGYDLLDADLTAFNAAAGDLVVAGEVIERYNVEVCGVERVAGAGDAVEAGDGDVDDMIGGSIRQQILDQFTDLGFTQAEAECVLGEIDVTDPDLTEDFGAFADAFAACGVDVADDALVDADLVQQFAEDLTAEQVSCLVDRLDLSDPALLDDPVAIAGVLTECGVDVSALLAG
ncbi:MAG: hypothetical protein QNJ12_10080 [Ilumatobacter sp.]|uniref:hypothetical protein n=1 Tax=Ilumatobacter sp. TaxID=1967498 RepID=UPI002633E650|nr:hypothetical protein [Ilumatobacter sp.]MDJ0769134.1 hypothetical protein [Ilumatobacter sp.]